ncbi:MAG: LptF/LptG family permease [Phycisphaerales bacterium]|nr:LptF/LptG family permease [Phycisphaerales bacterium]
MSILDRYIIKRFLWNFLALFALLFLFGVSVDLALQLDKFTGSAAAASASAAREGHATSTAQAFVWAVFSFYGPRVFQFYAYLCGLVSVAAMGFTLGQMNRHRELIALMAAGVGLQRVAVPILGAALALNVLQLANQELVLPRLAPLLIREHADVLRAQSRTYPVELTRDGAGNLFTAASFDPASGALAGLLVMERDSAGTAVRRLTAAAARWDAEDRSWILEDGWATTRHARIGADAGGPGERERVDRYATDLGPQGIAVRHSALYGQMLSLAQIRDMEQFGGVDPALLARYRYARLAAVLVNLLMLVVTIPSFLRRLPVNLLQQSVIAAGLAVPGLLGAFIGMTVELPGLPPAVGVFLPVAILIPIAMARVSTIQT